MTYREMLRSMDDATLKDRYERARDIKRNNEQAAIEYAEIIRMIEEEMACRNGNAWQVTIEWTSSRGATWYNSYTVAGQNQNEASNAAAKAFRAEVGMNGEIQEIQVAPIIRG